MPSTTITSDAIVSTLLRSTQGAWHRISGTILEIITEMGTASIQPSKISSYYDDGTDAVLVYRKGN